MAAPDTVALGSEAKLVSLEDWIAEGTPAGAAVEVPGDGDLDGLYETLTTAATIVVVLPSFVDGRAFSHARKLRDLGFDGALLATGDVLADQWQFLKRCGFSGLLDSSLASTAQTLKGFSQGYQADEEQDQPVYRRRPRA